MDVFDLIAYQEAEEKALSLSVSKFGRWWFTTSVELRASVERQLAAHVGVDWWDIPYTEVRTFLRKLAKR